MKRLLLGLLVLCSVAVAQTGVVSVERSDVPFFATIPRGLGAIFNIEGRNTGSNPFTGRIVCTIFDNTTGTAVPADPSLIKLYKVQDSQEVLCEETAAGPGTACYIPSENGAVVKPGESISGKIKVVTGFSCPTDKKFVLHCIMAYRTLDGNWKGIPTSVATEEIYITLPTADITIKLVQIVFFLAGAASLIYGLIGVI